MALSGLAFSKRDYTRAIELPNQNNRSIYKIYNGWWYVGRPTVEELRMDLRPLTPRLVV
jgi:hypothetical protein